MIVRNPTSRSGLPGIVTVLTSSRRVSAKEVFWGVSAAAFARSPMKFAMLGSYTTWGAAGAWFPAGGGGTINSTRVLCDFQPPLFTGHIGKI